MSGLDFGVVAWVSQSTAKPLPEIVSDFFAQGLPQPRRATGGLGCLGLRLEVALAQTSSTYFPCKSLTHSRRTTEASRSECRLIGGTISFS